MLLRQERRRHVRGVAGHVLAQGGRHHREVERPGRGEPLGTQLAHALDVRLLAEPGAARLHGGAHRRRVGHAEVGHEHGQVVGLERRGVHLHVCQPVVVQVALAALPVEQDVAAGQGGVEPAFELEKAVRLLHEHLHAGQLKLGGHLGELPRRVEPHHYLAQAVLCALLE